MEIKENNVINCLDLQIFFFYGLFQISRTAQSKAVSWSHNFLLLSGLFYKSSMWKEELSFFMLGSTCAPSFTPWATLKLCKRVRQQSRHRVLCENWPSATTTPEQGNHGHTHTSRAEKSPGTAEIHQMSVPVLSKAFISLKSKYKPI